MDDEDPEGDAQIQAEARAEEAAIQKICDELSLVMHEVSISYVSSRSSNKTSQGQSGWPLSIRCCR